ncbi:MAG: hypothetical protein R2690_10100 [Acidimicrobiales bacterium]
MRGADEVVRAFVFTDIEGSTRAWQADGDHASPPSWRTTASPGRWSTDGPAPSSSTPVTAASPCFADGADAVDAAVEMHGALSRRAFGCAPAPHLGSGGPA